MFYHRKLNKTYRFKKELHKRKNKKKEIDQIHEDKINTYISNANKRAKRLKENLYAEFSINSSIRNLNENELRSKNVISVFDSVLTRTLKIPENVISTDILVVQTYFFDVLKDIILNGFMYGTEKYVCFTASAGQIRTKKTVFIKESVFLKHQNLLMCGLTIDGINKYGGVNINKYLAYLALCNSATDEWKDFDINKTIVVDDMETTVRGIVDFIDDKTYDIIRQEMDVPINHTDGCGMILPRKSKKSMMVRLPWIKGLLVPTPFDKFIRENSEDCIGKKINIVTDIYGKQYDIFKDNIEIIFTKSQFKMWKYYSSWDEYKDNYLKYGCQAGKCNEEEDKFNETKLNYQMLQTLPDMSDDELKDISNNTKNKIINIGRDKTTMLKVLGVKSNKKNKNYIQQALEIYPELLNDTYSKEILKQVKKSMVREARAGKIDINGKYTFICPDLYAFCEWLFLGDINPKGLLNDGEVYCNLYKQEDKLDCLRSPHLYREHAIRKNVVDKEKGRWFVTNGVYTSCHDLISKLLQFDNDGDKGLVCANRTVIKVAETSMEGVVPLFYNMAKAEAEIVNNQSVYDGLKAAYTGGNIGMISNDITKLWNNKNINLDIIKWLCMENNFTIDYAKTLYKPKRPKEKGKLITNYTKVKTPHFFIYAKDKSVKEVEERNSSVVNKLEKIIPNPRIKFNVANVGNFDYQMLVSDKSVELDQNIINKYIALDLKSHFMINIDGETNNISYLYSDIRDGILKVNNDKNFVVNVLVEYLYNHKKTSFKTTLWECFGDVLVENLRKNVIVTVDEKTIQCESCGIGVETTGKNHRMCRECWKKREKELKRDWKRVYDKAKK